MSASFLLHQGLRGDPWMPCDSPPPAAFFRVDTAGSVPDIIPETEEDHRMPSVTLGIRGGSPPRPQHPASLPICVPSVERLPPTLSRRLHAETTWWFGYGGRHQPPSGTFHPDRPEPLPGTRALASLPTCGCDVAVSRRAGSRRSGAERKCGPNRSPALRQLVEKEPSLDSRRRVGGRFFGSTRIMMVWGPALSCVASLQEGCPPLTANRQPVGVAICTCPREPVGRSHLPPAGGRISNSALRLHKTKQARTFRPAPAWWNAAVLKNPVCSTAPAPCGTPAAQSSSRNCGTRSPARTPCPAHPSPIARCPTPCCAPRPPCGASPAR